MHGGHETGRVRRRGVGDPLPTMRINYVSLGAQHAYAVAPLAKVSDFEPKVWVPTHPVYPIIFDLGQKKVAF